MLRDGELYSDIYSIYWRNKGFRLPYILLSSTMKLAYFFFSVSPTQLIDMKREERPRNSSSSTPRVHSLFPFSSAFFFLLALFAVYFFFYSLLLVRFKLSRVYQQRKGAKDIQFWPPTASMRERVNERTRLAYFLGNQLCVLFFA